MKLRALVLALASAALPHSAQAADDFCSRVIIQAVNQFCQLLPNGLNLCQPVALVGPSAECTTPERQVLTPVPLGPPSLQPLAPWAAPYMNIALPVSGPGAAATPPDLPKIMADAPKPAEQAVSAAKAPTLTPVDVGATVSAALANDTKVAPVTATAIVTATATPQPAAAPEVMARPAPVAATVAVAASAATTATANVPVSDGITLAAPVVAVVAPAATRSEPVSAPGAVATSVAEQAALADTLAHFDFDSAVLTDAGRGVLDAWLAEAPKNKPLRVSGYADRLGPEPYNLKLSLRRADAVKHYLTGKGLDPKRIQLEAKGEADPVTRCKGGATPATKSCLAPNRRVRIDPE